MLLSYSEKAVQKTRSLFFSDFKIGLFGKSKRPTLSTSPDKSAKPAGPRDKAAAGVELLREMPVDDCAGGFGIVEHEHDHIFPLLKDDRVLCDPVGIVDVEIFELGYFLKDASSDCLLN